MYREIEDSKVLLVHRVSMALMARLGLKATVDLQVVSLSVSMNRVRFFLLMRQAWLRYESSLKHVKCYDMMIDLLPHDNAYISICSVLRM